MSISPPSGWFYCIIGSFDNAVCMSTLWKSLKIFTFLKSSCTPARNFNENYEGSKCNPHGKPSKFTHTMPVMCVFLNSVNHSTAIPFLVFFLSIDPFLDSLKCNIIVSKDRAPVADAHSLSGPRCMRCFAPTVGGRYLDIAWFAQGLFCSEYRLPQSGWWSSWWRRICTAVHCEPSWKSPMPYHILAFLQSWNQFQDPIHPSSPSNIVPWKLSAKPNPEFGREAKQQGPTGFKGFWDFLLEGYFIWCAFSWLRTCFYVCNF